MSQLDTDFTAWTERPWAVAPLSTEATGGLPVGLWGDVKMAWRADSWLMTEKNGVPTIPNLADATSVEQLFTAGRARVNFDRIGAGAALPVYSQSIPALVFTSDYMRINDAGLNGSANFVHRVGEFLIGFAGKFSADPTGNNRTLWEYRGGVGGASDYGWRFMHASDDTLRFAIFDNTGTVLDFKSIWSPGTDAFVVFVWGDGTNYRLVIDGSEVATTAKALGADDCTDNALHICGTPYGQYFQGDLHGLWLNDSYTRSQLLQAEAWMTGLL